MNMNEFFPWASPSESSHKRELCPLITHTVLSRELSATNTKLHQKGSDEADLHLVISKKKKKNCLDVLFQ